MTDTGEFRTDGGASWLNLLATQGQSFSQRPIERLSSREAALRWLTLMGLAPARAVTDEELSRLLDLREDLRELALSAVAGREPAPDARDRVQRIADGNAVAHLARMLREGDVSVDAALSALALQALMTLQGPDAALLSECAETDCRWVFLDTSQRRRWCPSPACASRGRVRAHRARLADSV